MSYHLQITLSSDQAEIVSRNNFLFSLSLLNKGDNPFPGGTISRLSIRFRNSRLDITEESVLRIPKINPGETKRIENIETFAIEDGLIWIEIMAEAQDKLPVRLYRGDLLKSPWLEALYVFSYEEMRIREKLDQILAVLNQINDKMSV